MRNSLVIICFAVIGGSLYTQLFRPLRMVSGSWPAPLSNPTVTSTRTLEEADADKPIDAEAFDVVVWVAYESRPNQPLVKAEAVLNLPEEGSVSDVAFTLKERKPRPWSDCFGKAMMVENVLPHPPAPEFEPGGMLGLWTDPHWVPNLRDLRMPVCILLTLIAVSWRHWLLGWVAVVSLLLLMFIAADAATRSGLRRIAENPALPVAQRAAATQIARWSYFHGPIQGSVP